MVGFKPQFSGLLSSITLAMVVVDALPHYERKPQDRVSTEVSGSDLDMIAPPMRRAGGGSGSSRARMMRQREAAALFEASRLAQIDPENSFVPAPSRSLLSLGERHSDHHHGYRNQDGHRRREHAAEDNNHIHPHSHRHDSTRDQSGERASEESDTVSPNGVHIHKRHNHGHNLDHHHHHGSHHHRPNHRHGDKVIIANDPLIISGNGNHIHSHSHKRHHHHHHHNRPDDTSKGGHSSHWYEHHHIEPNHPHEHHHHHHHHHNRASRTGPKRLPRSSDAGEDAFIAPASVRVKSGNKKQSGSRKGPGEVQAMAEPSSMKLVKKPKKADSGYYRAVQPAGQERKTDCGDEEKETRPVDETDGTQQKNKRSTTATGVAGGSNAPSTVPRILTGLHPTSKTTSNTPITPGIVNLLANSDGAKIGGLSISANKNVSSTAPYAYLIDSTPNRTEQAIFYMRQYEDQSFLRGEASKNPATQAVMDLLVSLQTSMPPKKLCATFDPMAKTPQMFGLSVCLDSNGAAASGVPSQSFRYSPGTGVIRPFYADEKALEDAETDELEHLYSDPNWNGTFTVAPGSSPLPMSASDPLFERVYMDPAMATPFNSSCSGSTCSKATIIRDPPVLSVQSKEESMRALIVGDSEYVSQMAINAQGEAKATDQGALMVFRAVYNTPLMAAGYGGDMPTKRTKRGVDTSEEMAPKWMTENSDTRSAPLVKETHAEDHLIEDSASGQTPKPDLPLLVHGTARTTGPPSEYTSLESSLKNYVGYTESATNRSPPTTKSPPPQLYSSSKIATNSRINLQKSDELDPSDKKFGQDPIPKPVINVAYFGDSGRSAPVPPEEQADNVRPILIADPGKKSSSTPFTLATSGKLSKEDQGSIEAVYLAGPKARVKGPAMPVSAIVAGGHIESVEPGIPIDASD